MTFWRLAWRNVLRNRRRTTITVFSIAIGLSALTFLWAFLDGMNRQMVENTTRYFAGDAQVHLAGYHGDPTLDLAMMDAASVSAAIRAHPAVASASVRMEGTALASRGDKSRGVILTGVSVAEERGVTRLFNAIVEGGPLDSTDGALIGAKLAESLALKSGDEIVLVGQGYDGSTSSARIRVRGIFRTKIEELDGYLVVMPIESVRAFLATPRGATAIALRLKDRDALESVRTGLSSQLGRQYEIIGWPTLLPMVAVSVRYHEVTGFVLLTVFFIVVAAGVANPILMAVLERTREFGVMLAVGMCRQRLLRLVLYEAMLLGVFGMLAGNAIGLSITAYFQSAGINLSAFESGLRVMPGLSDVVYPRSSFAGSFAISALVFLTATAVALYPAIKAARLDPVTAIRGFAGGRGFSGHGRAPHGNWPVFLLIAARNILRNPRRTAITAGGTAFAIVAFVFLFGYYDGYGEQLIDTATSYLTGHIQIEREGFRKDLAPELSLDSASVLLAAARRIPNVVAAAPRVQAQAVASSVAKSASVMLVGIDSDAERDVTFIDRAIVEGAALGPADDREVLIGRKLAAKLDVRLGERVVLMTQAADGELATAAYRVRGMFVTESGTYDGGTVFITLPAAQSLLALGTQVSTINLRLTNRAHVGATLDDLRTRLAAPGRSFVAWQDLLPQIDELVKLVRVMRTIVLAIVFAVVVLAVMNTVFMAVAERTREFGVMMALGTSPAAIVRMVVYETVGLMLLASIVGYGTGILLVGYFGRHGLDLSAFFKGYTSVPGITGIAYPRLMVESIIGPAVALFLASVVVSIYPAARAARLDPARAIRHA